MTSMQDRAAILVSEQIGVTQSLTPEGFLLCTDVRIARLGEMDYLPREVPEITPGDLGRVVLTRDADALFDPITLASFAGKPVTNDHPPQFVSPDVYKRFTVGSVLEPRRGEGVNDGYLVADLLIMDAQAIKDVRKGKREVSCGYNCDRIEIKPGLARQINIVGNHVALVSKGRAGPACAINDKESPLMAKSKTLISRIRAAFSSQDRDALEEELDNLKDDAPEADKDDKKTEDAASVMNAAISKAVADAIKPLADSVAAIQKSLKDADEEEPDGSKVEDDDEEKKDDETMDAAAFKDAWAETVSRAEILVPGIRVPTVDSAAGRSAITDLQRAALSQAFVDPKRSAPVSAVVGPKPDFSKMTSDAIAVAFRASSEMAKAANNAPKPGPSFQMPAQKGGMTAAKLQELNASRRPKL